MQCGHRAGPHAGVVSAGISTEVSELLMEAQLLQVSLPEIQELYRTLLAKPSSVQPAGRSSPVRPSGEKASVWEAVGGELLQECFLNSSRLEAPVTPSRVRTEPGSRHALATTR